MARKKTISTHHKKTSAEGKERDFPTMFFESVSAETNSPQTTPHAQDRRERTTGGRTERLIWMWSGVGVVMIIVFLSWARSLNASGALNVSGFFQKNNLIQESRQSLKYYFEKQNQDRAEMNAFADTLTPAPRASNTVLDTEQINQLKNKITALSTTTTSNAPVVLPSSLNKK